MMDRQEVYRQARDVFGAEAQLVVALEELCEAQKERIAEFGSQATDGISLFDMMGEAT